MALRPRVASKFFLLFGALLVFGAGATCRGQEGEGQGRKAREEDRTLLDAIRLPSDPRRSPDEQYYHRFVIRTQQGQTFVGAYWREEGSFLAVALDLFAVQGGESGVVGRRVFSGGLGGDVLALHVIDLDEDGRDDFLLIHKTGGMIATTGVTALRQTPTGFSEVFNNAGTDVLVYREDRRVRIMIKAKSSNEVDEYSWNPSKQTFEVTRTLDLLY